VIHKGMGALIHQKEGKMKTSLKFWIVAAIGFSVAACGKDGGGGGPTLGITSIPKATQSKPSFASNVFQKTLNLVSARQATAQTACPGPGEFVFSFDITGGKVYIQNAYAVLDEVEFEVVGSTSSSDDVEFGPFAVDLTGNDDNVPDSIDLAALKNDPAAVDKNFDEIKFKVKRLEDELTEQPKNLNSAQLAAFGTLLARAVAGRLAASVEIFAQPAGTFSADSQITDDARHVSGDDPDTPGDDNPSACDILEDGGIDC
jgi:hypothetical protein